MTNITLQSNAAEFVRSVEQAAQQYGFASKVALARTASATVKEYLPELVRSSFDRPTPWVQNAFFWLANADQTIFEIGVKNKAGNGPAQSNILVAEIKGGQRVPKRSERVLASIAGGPGYWVPGPGVPLDQYGNVSGAIIRKILSDLELQLATPTASKSMSKRKRKPKPTDTYFVRTTNGKASVWVMRGGKAIPALYFIAAPQYGVKFDFFGAGMTYAQQRYPVELNRAISEGWNSPK